MNAHRAVLATAAVLTLATSACRGDGPTTAPTSTHSATSSATSPTGAPPEATAPSATARPPPTALPTTPPPTSWPPTSWPPLSPPPAGDRAQVISRGDPNRRIVALTFDAGADTGHTAAILDTLAGEGVPASFGLTGRWAEANPDLVARIAGEGHQLVNHTYDHRSFTGVSSTPAVLTRAERVAQLERTDEVIRRITGQSSQPWFRPAFGDYDDSVNTDIAGAGYRYNLLWTVDSLGWQGLSAPAITERCVSRTVPGAILLFHVGEQSADAEALPAIISALRSDGYSFGTAADVVGV